jgi:uncharacterized protein (DUF3084 family)
MAKAMTTDLSQPLELIRYCVAKLTVIRDQIGEAEDFEAQNRKASLQLDGVTEALRQVRLEYAQVRPQLVKMQTEAFEKHQELEALKAEIAARNLELTRINIEIQKLRQRIGDAYDREEK